MPRTHIPPDDFGFDSQTVDINLIGDPLFLVFKDSVTIEANVHGLFSPDIPKGLIPVGNVLGPFSPLKAHGLLEIVSVGKDGKKKVSKFKIHDNYRRD